MGQRKTTWSVTEAKARLREAIERAQTEGPQTITRHGKSVAVLVSAAEVQRKTRRKGTLADFLANSPLVDSGIVIERIRDLPGDTVL